MVSKRLSLVHPTGNPNSRHAALGLGDGGLLHEVITTIAYNSGQASELFLRLLPEGLRERVVSEIGRRLWRPPAGAQLRCHPAREIIRLLLVKSGILRITGVDGQRLADLLYLSLDGHVANHHLEGINGIYAYEDGAATTFQAARQQGVKCFYDLPAMFYRSVRQIHTDEAERFPELSFAMGAAREPAWKLARKEQEVELADHIFVASTNTLTSLVSAGIARERITLNPYGARVDYSSRPVGESKTIPLEL